MEAKQTANGIELKQFLQITNSRHLNFNKVVKDALCIDTCVSNNQKHHQEKLQKFHDLYQAYKKHR